MNIKKIHIIGGPGSGKSYAANILSNKLSIKKFDLDDLFWENNSSHYDKRKSPDQRDKELNLIINLSSWIIEGVYHQWLGDSFRLSDTIIVLKPNVFLRDYRIIKRFIFRKLKILKSKKKETIKGLMELLKWNHGYDNDNLIKAYDLILNYKEKIIETNSADNVIKLIKVISEENK